MKRGIIMSGENPALIIEKLKTETRRIIVFPKDTRIRSDPGGLVLAHKKTQKIVPCPYGIAGDEMYIRETWRTRLEWNKCPPLGLPIQDPTPEEDAFWSRLQHIEYRVANDGPLKLHGRWRPSIHMCEWMARTTVGILHQWIERIQDITPDGCKAEGISLEDMKRHVGFAAAFHSLWDSLHGKGAWKRNDWVWAMRFTNE